MVLKPEANKSTQHFQPPSDSIQRRYSDSSEADGRHSDQSRLPPQSRSSDKLSDTTAPGSRLSIPSNDDYLHLPSPPGSPMPHHRRYQKIMSRNSCLGIFDNFHVCLCVCVLCFLRLISCYVAQKFLLSLQYYCTM